ncbi:MAG: tetratricopeptide repeat protein [Bdellovibrionaceae bacterium]|nr:tetratricopeptide repeat protein [Pseudobdellovibrionaceae bacterium]
MRSQSNLFLTLCLVITAGLVWSYSAFNQYFTAHSEEGDRAEVISRQLREEQFKRALAESRLRDFSVEVAGVLPAKDIAANGKLSDLKKVLREPAAVSLDLSGVIFERAKTKFSEKKYNESYREFRRLREDYPLSPHAIESAFLAGESAFLAGESEKCIEMADLMIEQYPDSELTGFLLLRLGQLNEDNGRAAEAGEIYRTVQKNFKNPSLIDQAKRLAKALELL